MKLSKAASIWIDYHKNHSKKKHAAILSRTFGTQTRSHLANFGIIFRTTKNRNRLLLELMARGGMRVGEVLKYRLY